MRGAHRVHRLDIASQVGAPHVHDAGSICCEYWEKLAHGHCTVRSILCQCHLCRSPIGEKFRLTETARRASLAEASGIMTSIGVIAGPSGANTQMASFCRGAGPRGSLQ